MLDGNGQMRWSLQMNGNMGGKMETVRWKGRASPQALQFHCPFYSSAFQQECLRHQDLLSKIPQQPCTAAGEGRDPLQWGVI